LVTHLHLDPLGGAAGDMLIAALLDARPEHEAVCLEAIRAAGLPASWRIETGPHGDGVLTGRRFAVEADEGASPHPDSHFTAILETIGQAPLAAAVAGRAAAVLELIGRAEAAVHGIALERVHFHELADWDSIADVVGAAALIEAIGPITVSLGPLPLGHGRIRTRHGWLPVPAPATARLIEGMPVHDDGIGGERVTPTGAAILRQLQPSAELPPGTWRLRRIGHGFGSRRLDGVSNVLRALVYERDDDAPRGGGDRVAVVTFEVDDQTPEALAVGLDHLRAHPDVLDVVQVPALGKRGRLATQIQLLVRPDALDAVIEQCFLQTTTIGLRHRIEARATLLRSERLAAGVEVKVVERPGGRRTVKAAVEATRDLGDHAAREERRRAAEAIADDGERT
jgi:uncharacterized protein (TIGR00299 family) protein